MKYKIIIILILSFLSSCGGGGDTAPAGPSANISFTYGAWGTKSYGAAFLPVTLHHNGGSAIYNASCDIQAMNGNIIVDTGFAYFANGGTITAGQSSVSEAIFFNNVAFTSTSVSCTWLYR